MRAPVANLRVHEIESLALSEVKGQEVDRSKIRTDLFKNKSREITMLDRHINLSQIEKFHPKVANSRLVTIRLKFGDLLLPNIWCFEKEVTPVSVVHQ